MDNTTKLTQMLKLQDDLNTYILGPEWTAPNPSINWRRAAWIESAELMDWIGWKWWKKQIPNLKQAHIELVDIFHFLLALAIVEELPLSNILENLSQSDLLPNRFQEYSEKESTTLNLIEMFVALLLNKNTTTNKLFSCFFVLCNNLELSFDTLYLGYISKNVLNIFRQNHGYKEGTYLKNWVSPLEANSTVEDNVYLEFFMEEAFVTKPEDLYTYLYSKLEQVYNLTSTLTPTSN